MKLPNLIATSVVRGSQQRQSHGGIYLIDLNRETVRQVVDWNTCDIDFTGRGWDRGLRGISVDADNHAIYVAASDELFLFDFQFSIVKSYRNRYLKHAHEIFIFERTVYLTSTGYNCLLGFELDRERYVWGLDIAGDGRGLRVARFDPNLDGGPEFRNTLHINNVYRDATGLYFSGMDARALLRYADSKLELYAPLPASTHNARPFKDGLTYNDTASDEVCYVSARERVRLPVPGYPQDSLVNADLGDSRLTRQKFSRGLCPIGETVVADGSSPSTMSVHDLGTRQSLRTINISMDIRNAIHGLEIWPGGL